MNTLAYNDTSGIEENLTSMQELKLFCHGLMKVKKQVLETGAGGKFFHADMGLYYATIYAIEDIMRIAKRFHNNAVLSYEAWDTILDKVDIITDNYTELQIDTDILYEVLGELKAYHAKEVSPLAKEGNIYYLPVTRGQVIQADSERTLAIKRLMLGTPIDVHKAIRVPSIESKRREVLSRLQNTLTPREAGKIESQAIEEQILLNTIQPKDIQSEVLRKINYTAIQNDDVEMIGYMSHYIKYEAANEKNYDPNIENSLKLGTHIKNIKPDHPIRIKTTEGEINILRIIPYFPTHEKVKVYYKAEILFQGKKKRVLMREDMFQVGNTTEFLGEFDKNNDLQPATRGGALFAIQSIHSEKNQRKKPEKTLRQRFSKNMSSLKNTVLGMFRK